MSDKIYIGSGKEKQLQYGPIVEVSFKREELEMLLNNYVNQKGYCNLTVSRRQNVSQYGQTHSITVNTYGCGDPQPQYTHEDMPPTKMPPAPQFETIDEPEDDIPF